MTAGSRALAVVSFGVANAALAGVILTAAGFDVLWTGMLAAFLIAAAFGGLLTGGEAP